ncbi:MAG: DNA-formamidopyrimidine glycosylase family protein [Planctomycetota bacterium]
MPELPDVTLYIKRLKPRIGGKALVGIRMKSPFLLRSVAPPPDACVGKRVAGFQRLGKRIAIGFEDELHLVFHLMIAGRFRWREAGAKLPGKLGLAAFDFEGGTLLLTEAGTKKRASLHVVQGKDALHAHDPGGIDVMTCGLEAFSAKLREENHTLKRSLCAPRAFSGIGNAYSDEILHRARLSPVQLSQNLSDAEVERLHEAVCATMQHWIDRLDEELGDDFPEKVTAFREGMAVHGRYGEPCPDCGSPVQRIVYASNETNYCAKCQTGGRLLADRALSRLLKKSWPKTLEELG